MLPAYWKKTELGEVAEYLNGRAFKPEEWKKEGLPIIRIQNLNQEDAPYNYSDEFFEERYLVKHGELLFAWSASLGAYIWKGNDAWLNQHIFKILPKDFVNKLYLYYYLEKVTKDLYAKAHGSGMVHVTKKKFEETPILLPPLPEQRTIVSKIEQLFSELDNGISNLRLAQEQLKVYRQAVLKKAFEGELTRKWREQQTDLPDARDLLEQIRKEREEVAKVSGKKVKPVKPLTEDEIAELPGLPEGWGWVKMEELGEVTGGLTKNSKRNAISTTLPYLRVANVYSNELRLDDLKYIGIEEQEVSRVLLKEGDLLVVEGNGSVDQIGRVAIWNGKISPCIHQNHIIKVRFEIVEIGKFILYWLLSFDGRNQITKVASSTSGLYTLNLSKIASLCIPVAPLPEQHVIVEEIETRLSVCDKMAQDIEEALEKAEALRQSILKKAFEGKLLNERELAEVRRAEDWEPAEVLLERVRAERAGNGKKRLIDFHS